MPEIIENEDSYVLIARNGRAYQPYSFGSMLKADFVLNANGRFDDDSEAVASEWNDCISNCQGDWWSFVQVNGDTLEVIVVFARDEDAAAFENGWQGASE